MADGSHLGPMIHFNLRCAMGHEFEAWFKSAKAFDAQAKRCQVTCAVCGSGKIEKAPMAPAITAKGGVGGAAHMREALTELRTRVEENCDYVGERFAAEARKIHYGETGERGIYGESTDQEARELVEEGIKVSRIPWLRRLDS